MKVKLFNGETFEAATREEAVVCIKRELKAWMVEGDHIGWFPSSVDTEQNRKPSCAQVICTDGEMTDAYALIYYN